MAAIYIVTNTNTGRQYVGQTRLTVQARWRAHCVAAVGPKPSCRLLYAAIRKYGPEAFTLDSISLPADASQADIDAAERQEISDRGTLAPHGYNLRTGGHRGAMHESTKAKLAAAHQGRPKSAAWKAQISEIHRGRAHSPERVARMRAGRWENEGWRHSPDTLRKMSSAKKGRPQHPNQIAALRAAHVGARRSPETRARISAAKRAAHARRLSQQESSLA